MAETNDKLNMNKPKKESNEKNKASSGEPAPNSNTIVENKNFAPAKESSFDSFKALFPEQNQILTQQIYMPGNYNPIPIEELAFGFNVNDLFPKPPQGTDPNHILNDPFDPFDPNFTLYKNLYSLNPSKDLMSYEKIHMTPLKEYCEFMETFCAGCRLDLCKIRPGVMVYVDMPNHNRKILFEYEVERICGGLMKCCPYNKRYVGVIKGADGNYLKIPAVFSKSCDCCDLIKIICINALPCAKCCCGIVYKREYFAIPLGDGTAVTGAVTLFDKCCESHYYEVQLGGVEIYRIYHENHYYCCDEHTAIENTGVVCCTWPSWNRGIYGIRRGAARVGEIKFTRISIGEISCISTRSDLELFFPKESNIVERYALMIATMFINDEFVGQAKSY